MHESAGKTRSRRTVLWRCRVWIKEDELTILAKVNTNPEFAIANDL